MDKEAPKYQLTLVKLMSLLILYIKLFQRGQRGIGFLRHVTFNGADGLASDSDVALDSAEVSAMPCLYR